MPAEIEVALLTGGGDRHYAFGLAMSLVSKGVVLDVIGGDEVDSPEMHTTPNLSYFHLRRNSRRDAGYVAKVWRVLSYYGHLVAYAATAKPQVFHILWNNKFEHFDRTVLMLYYRLLGKRIVLTAHNVNVGVRDGRDTRLNRLTLGIQYRLTDHVFVHTEQMRTELVQAFGVPDASIGVIRYGINNAVPGTTLTSREAKQRLGIGDGEKTILFFGNIAAYKGLEYLIDAFEQLVTGGGDYRLIVAGRAKDTSDPYVAAILERLGRDIVRGRTLLRMEFIPDEEMEVYLKAADVTALPYTRIFQSGVLFLAYSFGLPVIASDVGSLREDVVEGETGYVCKPRDPVDLAKTIERYFASSLYRDLDSHRGRIRAYVEERHSWEAVAATTRNVYAQALARKRSRAGRRNGATSLLTAALVSSTILAGMAEAAEWYVDNSGPAPCSNDPSGGSQGQPWCGINYAVGRAGPGDIVYVKNGTYREEVYIDGKNGGPDYIALQSYPGHFPVIRGSGVDGGRNRIVNSSFVKLIGFTITNFQQGLFVEASSNVVLQSLEVHDVGQEAVHIKSNSSFVTLQGSTIRDTRKWKYNGEGVYIGTSSSQQPDSPPYDNTHDILVQGNTIHNTTDECIEAKEGTYNVTIDGNWMHDCLTDGGITSPSWGAVEVMEHEHYYGSNPNHVIKNNVIRAGKTGIGVHTGATVFNNVIYGQADGFRGISIDNADGDDYVRRIYHNTIDVPSPRAVVSSRGALVDIQNNIGPRSPGNIAARNAFFVDRAARDYRLTARSAPIDAGADLMATVPLDIAGVSRSSGALPDLGAHEFPAGPRAGASPFQRR